MRNVVGCWPHDESPPKVEGPTRHQIVHLIAQSPSSPPQVNELKQYPQSHYWLERNFGGKSDQCNFFWVFLVQNAIYNQKNEIKEIPCKLYKVKHLTVVHFRMHQSGPSICTIEFPFFQVKPVKCSNNLLATVSCISLRKCDCLNHIHIFKLCIEWRVLSWIWNIVILGTILRNKNKFINSRKADSIHIHFNLWLFGTWLGTSWRNLNSFASGKSTVLKDRHLDLWGCRHRATTRSEVRERLSGTVHWHWIERFIGTK